MRSTLRSLTIIDAFSLFCVYWQRETKAMTKEMRQRALQESLEREWEEQRQAILHKKKMEREVCWHQHVLHDFKKWWAQFNIPIDAHTPLWILHTHAHTIPKQFEPFHNSRSSF